jgi:hypothetical protein
LTSQSNVNRYTNYNRFEFCRKLSVQRARAARVDCASSGRNLAVFCLSPQNIVNMTTLVLVNHDNVQVILCRNTLNALFIYYIFLYCLFICLFVYLCLFIYYRYFSVVAVFQSSVCILSFLYRASCMSYNKCFQQMRQVASVGNTYCNSVCIVDDAGCWSRCPIRWNGAWCCAFRFQKVP